MARRHPVLRGIAIATTLVVLLVIGSALVSRLTGGEGSLLGLGREAVGVVEVRGVISDSDDVVAALKRFAKAGRIKAVVLRVDSPGGGVAPAQEIYEEVRKIAARKPVIASLGNVAASGGYYVASACSAVVADPGTLTGSIGVIMGVRNVKGLAEKLGVREEVVKSGRFKDIGNPLRELTPEERALLQSVLDDVYEQFIEAVARGRGLDPARVRELADGRVFSGAQAKAVGLVDQLGGLERAVALAAERGGISGEPRVERSRMHRPWWRRLAETTLGTLVAGAPCRLGGGLLYLYPGAVPGLAGVSS